MAAMTKFRWAAAALSVGLLVTGCASSTADGQTPSQSPTPSPTETPTPATETQLTLTFDDCADCQVSLQRAVYTLDAQGERQYEKDRFLGPKTVTDGAVQFTLDTATSAGWVVVIDNPDGTDAGYAAPVVALTYEGMAAGTAVSEAQSSTQTSGAPCWAGTDQAEVTIHISTRRYTPDDWENPGEIHDIRTYWANPTVDTLIGSDNYFEAYFGGLGTQDLIPCRIYE